MKKLTIAVSSANNIDLTEACLKSIPTSYSVIVYDDSSTEPVEELCAKLGVGFVGHSFPKGLTNLWNVAFGDFLKTNSDILLITNNDILFPRDSIEQMVDAFSIKNPIMLGPLSNRPGACVDGGQYQDVRRYLQKGFPDIHDSANMQVIQDELVRTVVGENRTRIDKYICGFCFMVDKRISGISYDAEHLTDPHNINVGNETWLCTEIQKKNGVLGDISICCTAFVFHYEGRTTRWCPGKKPSPTSLRPGNTRENLWRNP